MNDLKTVLADVSKTILPVIGAITVLQLLAGLPKETLARFLLGAIMVIIGLTLFTLGINLGLLPMGEAVGSALATRGSVAILIGVAFILGLSVTIAEPNTQILAHYVDFARRGGRQVDPDRCRCGGGSDRDRPGPATRFIGYPHLHHPGRGLPR